MGIKIGNTDISKIKIASGLTPRLPSAYQEVEYIQSSGTQYIDTGWTPSSNYCKTVMDATIYTGNSGYSVYYGMTNGSRAYSLHTDHSTRQLNVGSVGNRNTGISFSNGTNGTFTFEANNGSISVDIAGSTYTGSYSGSVAQTSRNMYIFAFNENGSVARKVNMKLGELKIYSDADTLVRDFIPCYRIADGVIGLYDFVNDVFYTNAGSGTFSKGADVNLPYKEIKKVYLGSTQVRPSGWQPGANTIAYYKFDGNLNDSSGNNNTCTVARGSATYYTVSGENQAITCSGNVIKSGVQQQNILTATHTLIFWINLTQLQTDMRVMGALGASGSITHIGVYTGPTTPQGLTKSIYFWQPNKTGNYTQFSYEFSSGTWYNVALTIDASLGCSCYINGTQIGNIETIVNSGTADFYFGNNYQLTDSSRMDGYLDDIIIEDKVRTAQEVADYFNQTKSNYGIS